MKKGIIDRFEGDIVVVEFDGVCKDIDRAELPYNCKIGDVLIFKEGVITIEEADTQNRRKEVQDLMDELFED
ncbi:pyruvate kinase [Bacillus sp. FJAT-18019]|nr:pyruvate kinase [Bacillus sp. FJAT-18019]